MEDNFVFDCANEDMELEQLHDILDPPSIYSKGGVEMLYREPPDFLGAINIREAPAAPPETRIICDATFSANIGDGPLELARRRADANDRIRAVFQSGALGQPYERSSAELSPSEERRLQAVPGLRDSNPVPDLRCRISRRAPPDADATPALPLSNAFASSVAAPPRAMEVDTEVYLPTPGTPGESAASAAPPALPAGGSGGKKRRKRGKKRRAGAPSGAMDASAAKTPLLVDVAPPVASSTPVALALTQAGTSRRARARVRAAAAAKERRQRQRMGAMVSAASSLSLMDDPVPLHFPSPLAPTPSPAASPVRRSRSVVVVPRSAAPSASFAATDVRLAANPNMPHFSSVAASGVEGSAPSRGEIPALMPPVAPTNPPRSVFAPPPPPSRFRGGGRGGSRGGKRGGPREGEVAGMAAAAAREAANPGLAAATAAAWAAARSPTHAPSRSESRPAPSSSGRRLSSPLRHASASPRHRASFPTPPTSASSLISAILEEQRRAQAASDARIDEMLRIASSLETPPPRRSQ